MLTMSRQPPTDMAALKTIPGIGGEQAERRGREILAAVKRGLEIPDQDLPRIERPARRTYDPAFEARLERLKAARNKLAARLDLQPGVLCPNGTLEAIARANPGNLQELGAIEELRRWQLREIGEELLVAVKEPPAGARGGAGADGAAKAGTRGGSDVG
jgi:ribonuclease D